MNSEKQTIVNCPHCKTKVIYNRENPYRPFCSERCKLIDLGAWADENYRIPLQSQVHSLESSAANSTESVTDEDDSF